METEPVRLRRPAVACIECRRRKIRCDRRQPCIRCYQSLLLCSYASRPVASSSSRATATITNPAHGPGASAGVLVIATATSHPEITPQQRDDTFNVGPLRIPFSVASLPNSRPSDMAPISVSVPFPSHSAQERLIGANDAHERPEYWKAVLGQASHLPQVGGGFIFPNVLFSSQRPVSRLPFAMASLMDLRLRVWKISRSSVSALFSP